MNQALTPKRKMLPTEKVSVPTFQLPLFRTQIAVDHGVERNLIFKTWGGLGDQICAEPTLRYALKQFKECDVSLASQRPELFKHLKFKRVFDLKEERPVYENYLVFDTITAPDDSNLVWQFFSHMITNCVDFPSLCAYRCQLPISDKEPMITGEDSGIRFPEPSQYVFIHAGRHWVTKTFPKEWWDAVIERIVYHKRTPVLVGADTDDNRGTVDVDSSFCMDLRNKLSITETTYILQRAKVLLTNDSSPLHMAASTDPFDHQNTGNAWIGFIATCKHPDFISHWRKGQWSWRMVNHGRGGLWEIIDNCPNKENGATAEFVEESILRSWLPNPQEFADWAVSKL